METAQGRGPRPALTQQARQRGIEKAVFKLEPLPKHKHLFMISKTKQKYGLLSQFPGHTRWQGIL